MVSSLTFSNPCSCDLLRSSTALREWHQLLADAGLVEHESENEAGEWCVVGAYSCHEQLFSRLVAALPALKAALHSTPLHTWGAFVDGLVAAYSKWPANRRGVACAWVADCLLSLAQREADFEFISEYVLEQSQLSAGEHCACDDAGVESLLGASCKLFVPLLDHLAQRPDSGVASVLSGDDVACARCLLP